MTEAFVSDAALRFLAENTEDGEEHFGVHIDYNDLYASMLFLAAIYAAGIGAVRFLSMPALVGEIFAGILLGPNLANIVPNAEAFVMLGEIGLVLLVLEAGIDIDLTTLKLVGSRGLLIALVGTLLPIVMAFGVAWILGYTGVTAIAAACTFAPTSLGIAMNVLRRSGILNTPVGQLVVAAAIIDDMVALVILSQLRAFVGEVTVSSILLPIVSALAFLLVGGYLAVFVLPNFLNRYLLDPLEHGYGCSREWMSLAIMFSFLLLLIPTTYYAQASPLMGAFLAGLVFCSSREAHNMFVSQFKRVMQWLMRIFFAASIGFQVPIQMFASWVVIRQGLLFTVALLGKVVVGFMVPNFSASSKFTGLHLRDCLVVGFSMAAEGEFAFVIAVFAVMHNLISKEVYASVVLAVLFSTIIAPLFLRTTIDHFNKQIQTEVFDDKNSEGALEKGIREKTVVFYCIQIKSTPSWGLQTKIMTELTNLNLDVIDHRAWHPRQGEDILVNEVYARDVESFDNLHDIEGEKRISTRIDEIHNSLSFTIINQRDKIIKVQRWIPDMSDSGSDGNSSDDSISEQMVRVTRSALEASMKETAGEDYVMMGDDAAAKGKGRKKRSSLSHNQVEHLDSKCTGRLEGLFRHDLPSGNSRTIYPFSSDEGIELL